MTYDDKKQLRVAICIPVYEKKELLERAVCSIIIQTYRDFFIVITDDSNSNEVSDYINEFRKINDIDIFYIHNAKQLGASNNTNKAIEVAMEHKADLIKLLFEDDWFTDANSLKRMVEEIDETNSDIIFSANWEVYDNRKIIHVCDEKYLKKIKRDYRWVFTGNPLGAPSNVMYRINSIRLDGKFTWLLDVDFYIRLLKGRKWCYIKEPLISVGHDGEQLTDYYAQHPMEATREFLMMLKKYEELQTLQNNFLILRRIITALGIVSRKKIKKIIYKILGKM